MHGQQNVKKLAYVILFLFKNWTYIVNHIFKTLCLYIGLVVFEHILS